MNNKLIALAVLLLSISILISGVLISNAINELSSQESLAYEEAKSVLMSKEEAAEYLGINIVEFNDRLADDSAIKRNLNSYLTYKFLPFMEMNGTKYFTKDTLDKWVEFQTH